MGDYMAAMKEEDEEGFKRHFSKFIANGITPENVRTCPPQCRVPCP